MLGYATLSFGVTVSTLKEAKGIRMYDMLVLGACWCFGYGWALTMSGPAERRF